jgi:uncharacterized protein (DUF697 family)
VPRWSDFGNVLTTVRELDVGSVRSEADQTIAITCVGHDEAVTEISRLLHRAPQRYPLSGPTPITGVPIEQFGGQLENIRSAQLLILAIDARRALSQAEADSFARLDALALPYLVAVINGAGLPSTTPLGPAALARLVAIPDPAALDAQDRLAAGLLERLPAELQLAAARRLPGLRAVYSRELIAATSFSNAAYALASGLPEQIPLLNIPFAAADILVLTKNQAMLVYRLALAHGAPPEFQDRIREVIPVVGGAFLWRQAARSLIGLIPIWGLLPKVAIAYAGTYTTGVAAWRWFESGEMVSREQLKRITQEALTIGRARAGELIAKARTTGDRVAGQARTTGDRVAGQARQLGSQAETHTRSIFTRLHERLPFRRKRPAGR